MRRSPSAVVARLFAVGVVAAVLLVTSGLALEVPYLSGRVNDYAEMLSGETESRISARLEAFEQATGSQVAVLTIPSLEGEALEEFSLRVAETWALGRKDVDDGVLLLIARDDRKMRIEVGYGLEHQLTDAESGRILRNVLRPQFQAGNFDGGVEEAVEVLIGTLEGADVIPPDPSDGPTGDLPMRLGMFGFFLAIISVFAMTALFSSGCHSWFLYVFLMPFFGAFPSALLHPKAGVYAVAAWAILFPIVKFVLARTDAGKRWVKAHPGWSSWSSGGGGGFSGGGFSGGGFSGGGGSFGGGGASGSW